MPTTSLPVFSPSETTLWEQCPTKWLLDREGWRPRTYTYADLCRMAGQAFAHGMVTDPDEAASFFERLLQHVENVGGVWEERAVNTTPALKAAWRKSLEWAVAYEPILPQWHVATRELPLERPDGAYMGTPDATLEHTDGTVMVRDYKWKYLLDPKYETRTVRGYLDSMQARQYMYFTGARYFNPLVVVATPQPHFLGTDAYLELSQEERERWYHSQENKWLAMHHHALHPSMAWMAGTHEDQFGLCPFYNACFSYDRHPERMLASGDYIQVEKGTL